MHGKLVVAVLAAGVLAGCGLAGITGNGVIREEARDVGAFDGVSVGYGLTANVTLGETAAVTLEGDENLLPYVHTEVRNGRLEVTVKDAIAVLPSQEFRITVVTPRLVSAEASGGASIIAQASKGPGFTAVASGGSHVTICDLETERVSANASGGSRIRLVGSSRELSAVVSGGSNLNAAALNAESVQVDGSGGSTGALVATREITGSLSGGSVFQLHGSPSSTKVATSGASALTYAE